MALSALTTAAAPEVGPVRNRAPLADSCFYRLPLTSVRPKGWLLDQLRLQADGLTGHLDESWPDVGPDSGWLGGKGDSWERGPYYLDGLVPLAYLLGEPRLIAKARPWIEWTLTHQRRDGAIGPEKNRDWWPIMIMLKVLTQYEEATGDPRVIPVLEKYFAYQSVRLDRDPLRSWAAYRWPDEVASILWVYNRTGNPRLLELARRLQAGGFDWVGFSRKFPFAGKVPLEQLGLSSHGVNNAMGLKTAALWSLISQDADDREATAHILANLDRFHGLPNGMFSADEHLAGRNPSQGTELCAVVETMFSLEIDLGVLGDPALGDRLEKIAFNPLPGGITADLQSHQYDQQPNQVLVSLSRRDWSDNGSEANLFGVAGVCCTANLHQGWPKFTAALWMASRDEGLAVAAYAPCAVHTTVRGVNVAVDEITEYPFRDRVSLVITPAAEVRFPLYLRIPSWTQTPRVAVNGQELAGVRAATYHRIDRVWRRGDRVEITFPMAVRVIRGFNQSISVERGPLVFSLKIGESWRQLRLPQHRLAPDWEVFPTSPWNYGLRVDTGHPAASFQIEEAPVGRQPFDAETAPVKLWVTARRLPQWVLVNDSAAPPPVSPVRAQLAGKKPADLPDETVELIPYAAARLRITSFPVLAEDPLGSGSR